MYYKIFLTLLCIYSVVYTISFAVHELKSKKTLSFFGVMVLAICSVFLLFWSYLLKF